MAYSLPSGVLAGHWAPPLKASTPYLITTTMLGTQLFAQIISKPHHPPSRMWTCWGPGIGERIKGSLFFYAYAFRVLNSPAGTDFFPISSLQQIPSAFCASKPRPSGIRLYMVGNSRLGCGGQQKGVHREPESKRATWWQGSYEKRFVLSLL